jgi:hypothetical protein
VEGEGHLPLSEALGPDEFADSALGALFRRIRDAREDGRRFTFDGLFAELDSAAEKALASDLFLFGSAALSEAARMQVGRVSASLEGQFDPALAAEQAVSAWADLEAVRRRESAKRSAEPAEWASNGVRFPATAATSPSELEGTPIHDNLSPLPAPRPLGGDDDGTAMAAERLARIRARGHDATAVSALFRRGAANATESGRKDSL